jgi:tetratricopeptide (TPR) repeat protein
VSKVNEIRRKASEAVRGRRYDRAIELYLKLCQVEPTNGTPRNELGDLYLKTGNTVDAIESFSLSARLYNDFGLTNNAVAVFKKILRHDPNHLDSLWGLAEIRREQGMDADASTGYLDYLSRAEQVPEAGREEFFKRSGDLVKTMADDLEILSRLEEIYRAADRGDDVARVLIAKAGQAHLEGEFEVRDRYVEHAREECEILDALPAYQDYLDITDPVKYGDDDQDATVVSDDEDEGVHESGVIELDDDPTVFDIDVPGANVLPEESAPATVAINTEALDLGFDFQPDELDQAVSRSIPVVEELDLEGPMSGIESGVAPVAGSESDAEDPDLPSAEDEVVEAVAESIEDAEDSEADHPEPSGSMNLLDEILADESFNVEQNEDSQIVTIAEEVGGQIAGDVDADDFGGQYELGVVYMDMGLFEQALVAFDAAGRGDDYRLGALEMRGTCLLRLGRDRDAMEAFEEGLGIHGAPEKAYLGLLYGLGCCHELRAHSDQALEFFHRVAEVDERFLDVADKLEQLTNPG